MRRNVGFTAVLSYQITSLPQGIWIVLNVHLPLQLSRLIFNKKKMSSLVFLRDDDSGRNTRELLSARVCPRGKQCPACARVFRSLSLYLRKVRDCSQSFVSEQLQDGIEIMVKNTNFCYTVFS